MLVSAILIGVCSIRVYLKHYTPARFFILAYVSLIASVLLLTGRNYTLLPITFLTTQSILIGTVGESILLSLAIADTINLLRNENRRFHSQLLESRESELSTLKEKFYRDSMTGLFNRNRMVLDMQKSLENSLFIVNADNFRQINDLYGTIIGNKVLIEMAKRLRDNGLPQGNRTYRLHADEFAVVIEAVLPPHGLKAIAERLIELCQGTAFGIDSLRIPLTVTVGIGSGAEDLMGKADTALNHARRHNMDFANYAPEFETKNKIQANLQCIDLLRYAIENDTVFPLFQPIMSNVTGVIEKYEALMRIRDRQGNIIPPGVFLEVAKSSKLYPRLSGSLIRKAIERSRTAKEDFSINISINDILNKEGMNEICESIASLPSDRNIVFEILESESIQAYEPVISFIGNAKSHGCKIAIDDFGSGYSNFRHILNLSVDYLKLDSTLIKEIHVNTNARVVTETISQFARRHGIRTIAEYVHSKDVYDVVREIGIDYSQGYFIGEPKPLP
jgi:diguanylate cyclase (GGDEF)-like protein